MPPTTQRSTRFSQEPYVGGEVHVKARPLREQLCSTPKLINVCTTSGKNGLVISDTIRPKVRLRPDTRAPTRKRCRCLGILVTGMVEGDAQHIRVLCDVAFSDHSQHLGPNRRMIFLVRLQRVWLYPNHRTMARHGVFLSCFSSARRLCNARSKDRLRSLIAGFLLAWRESACLTPGTMTSYSPV